MPVDEDINLDNPDGLTQEDIEALKRQAEEIELYAENIEENVRKVEEGSKKVKDATGGLNLYQQDLLRGDTGEMVVPVGQDLSNEKLTEMVIDILKKMKEAEKERKENAASIEEVKTHAQQFQEAKGGIQGAYGQITSFRANPFGFGKGKLMGLLGKAGLAGLVAAFAIQMAEQMYNQVLQEVKSQFQAGGAWDKRKLVHDELNEYNTIAYLTRIRSGEVFFTADAGSDLRQGAPRGVNNTRDLRDGHMRYIQFHAGI